MENQIKELIKGEINNSPDEENIFHPKQIYKNNDVEFIKLAYKMLFDDIQWYKKNLEAINKQKYG